MHHDEIVALVGLGIKLFTDAHKASQHHTTHNNLAVAGDLYKVGQKLYKIGSDARQNNASVPLFTSSWRVDDGTNIGFAFSKESGTVALSYPRLDGNGYNNYLGAGEVYSDKIAMVVSGYNYRTGDFLIMQCISNDGYSMAIASWVQGYDIAYEGAVRLSEWSYDYF